MAREDSYYKYDIPSKFDAIEMWVRDGLIDKEIAYNLGIGLTTFYRYRKVHKEFCEVLKRNKVIVDAKVENALLKRALGYDFEETVTEVQIGADGEAVPKIIRKIKKHIAGDVTAQVYWTKNRNPEKWRDVNRTEHTGPGGSSLFKGLTDEQLDEKIEHLKSLITPNE